MSFFSSVSLFSLQISFFSVSLHFSYFSFFSVSLAFSYFSLSLCLFCFTSTHNNPRILHTEWVRSKPKFFDLHQKICAYFWLTQYLWQRKLFMIKFQFSIIYIFVLIWNSKLTKILVWKASFSHLFLGYLLL